MILVLTGLAFWCAAWRLNVLIARRPATPLTRIAVPAIFGITLLIVWELLVRGLNVPGVILPAPTSIAARFADSADILWIDFIQTFVKGALFGIRHRMRSRFRRRDSGRPFAFPAKGIASVGNFVAALPIVGTAPIFVMWFGFRLQSKAAVVVAMVFSRLW